MVVSRCVHALHMARSSHEGSENPEPYRHAFLYRQWSLRTACHTHNTFFMQEEIYSSSYAAAAYLESVNFPKDKKVS